MKTVFNWQNNKVMKNYKKYICLFLAIVGMSTHAWGATTVSKTTPWTTSGTFDSNISWNAYKGAGSNSPYITSESKLRLYKNTSNQGGGLLNITAKNGCVITSITITFSSGTCGYRLSDATYNGKKSDYTACSSGSAIAFSNVTAVQFANIDADAQLDVATVSVTYAPACTAYDVTLSGDPAGTLTNGTISSSAASACEGVTVSLTATPSAGYSFSSWTITKTSNGNNVTASVLEGNTLTMPDYAVTVNATFAPQTYTVTLNPNGGSGSNQAVSATYDAAMPTTLTGGGAIVIPTKTGYTFDGWVKNSDGTGTKYYTSSATSNHTWDIANNTTIYAKWIANTISITLDKNGGDANGSASIKYDATTLTSKTDATRSEWNVVGYYAEPECTNKVLTNTGLLVNYSGYVESGKWVRNSATTLYAKWSKTQYTVTFNMNGHGDAVPAQEVESGDPAVRPTPDPSADDWRFLGWYDAASGGSEWNFSTGITGNTTIHAHWEAISYNTETYKAWCEPNISFSGDIHLTSVNGVSVYSTSTTSNLLHIISDDLAGVNKLDITYLDADNGDAVVAKESSLFRLCNDGSENYNLADGSQIDVSSSNTCDLTYSIRYTPSEPGVTNHYKIQVAMKRGSGPGVWTVKTATYDVYGRSLPAEFVVASKFNGEWYALPNTLEATEVAAKAVAGIKITVDNTTTPTKAVYAPNTAVYQGEGRYAAGTNMYGIRLTDGTNHLQVSSTPSVNYMWLSPTGSAAHQDWWLSSSDFGAYSVTIPSTGTKKLGMVGGNIGYFASPTSPSEQIYFLPIENKLVDKPAIVTEWGQHSVIMDVDAQTASSASAHFGDRASAEETESFGQTLTSVKGSASKYNYTLSFNTMDFSAHKGELLYIDWLDGEDNVIGTSQLILPWIIASSGTMSAKDATKGHWDTEVHVLPGVTLEADAGSFASSAVTVGELNIYPGATVKVTTGTLKATNLILRNGWTRAGSKSYDVARLHIGESANLDMPTHAYADWYIDYDQYYPIAVPWSVTTSGMSYKNSNSAASAGVKLRYYDGASRATNGQTGVGESTNWKVYDVDGKAYPATLEPGKGYAMTAKRPKGKAFSIVRMPLTIPSAEWINAGEKGEVSGTHKDQVTVTAHGKDDPSKPTYTTGWNFIANPYMSLYSGSIEYSDRTIIKYVNIPDIDFKEFGQYATALYKLAPSSGFFVQAPKTGDVTFGTSNRAAAAPAYRAPQTDVYSEQQAYIVVANDEMEDVMGLLISEKYTAEYELNADLEKLMSDGNSLRTYMRYGDMNMAYVAINEMLAKEQIPVSVRIPADGEYTFRIHEASIADELEGIYLTDYQTGTTTNLLYDSYTFNAVAGTDNVRFAINAVIGKREVPTSVDISDSDKDRPTKFIWNDKVYILHNNVIYDSTGKRVNVINK